MAPYIDAWFALTLLIVGASHAARPRLWGDFFNALKATGFAPVAIGLYTLPTGLALLLAHSSWAWDWPVIVTIAGWSMTIKATVYLLFPSVPERVIAEVDRRKDAFNSFRIVGLVMVPLGVGLAWHAFRHLPA